MERTKTKEKGVLYSNTEISIFFFLAVANLILFENRIKNYQ